MEIPCDVVIIAIGQIIDSIHFESSGISTNRRRIVADPSGAVPGMPGVFTGGDCFFGPATGSFFIVAQHLVLRMGLVRASGTAKAMNLASNAGALAGFAAGGAVVWALGAPLALASIAGNLLGVRLAVRVGARAVRSLLYLVLTGLLATLVWRFVL